MTEKEFNFIERIRALGVRTNIDEPAIIGVDLVIFEFKEFIRLLKNILLIKGYDKTIDEIDKLAGEKLR